MLSVCAKHSTKPCQLNAVDQGDDWRIRRDSPHLRILILDLLAFIITAQELILSRNTVHTHHQQHWGLLSQWWCQPSPSAMRKDTEVYAEVQWSHPVKTRRVYCWIEPVEVCFPRCPKAAGYLETRRSQCWVAVYSRPSGAQIIDNTYLKYQDFFDSSAGKESAWNVEDSSLIPGSGWSPGEGKGYPLQHSGLENSTDYIALIWIKFTHSGPFWFTDS